MFTEKELNFLRKRISSEQLDDFISKIQFPTNLVDELDDLALFLLRKFPNDIAAQIFSFMAADDKYNSTQDEIIIQDLHVAKKSAFVKFIYNKLINNPEYIKCYPINMLSYTIGCPIDIIQLTYNTGRYDIVVNSITEEQLGSITGWPTEELFLLCGEYYTYAPYKNGNINCVYYFFKQNS